MILAGGEQAEENFGERADWFGEQAEG